MDPLPSDYRFQVNLKDLIGILSHHLYRAQDVFLRELTQNAMDAVTARRNAGSAFEAQIEFELLDGDGAPVLSVVDNGCGLTQEEIHEFLATIGTSSKRQEAELIAARADFIGQFGIGLLSAFMVSDEIVLLTRSHKSETTYEWRGHSDGTYTLTESSSRLEVGTQLFLRASVGCDQMFEPDYLRDRLGHYCAHLPTPIYLIHDDKRVQINRPAPWSRERPAEERKELAAELAGTFFAGTILDTFPIEGDYVSGWAYLMPSTVLGGAHRNAVYIRNMFIGANIHDLLPEWACLFSVILHSDHLTPSASRETLYQDESLVIARQEIERALTIYLRRLHQERPGVMAALILQYEPLLKNIAMHNEPFLQCVHQLLTFESNRGRLPLQELLATGATYVTDVDEYHKLVPIASASGQTVINAGYSFEPALMQQLNTMYGDKLTPMDGTTLLKCLKPVSETEQNEWLDTMALLTRVLHPYALAPRLTRFQPDTIPMLYFEGEARREQRRMRHFQETANDLFQDILADINQQAEESELMVNVANPLIQNLQSCGNTAFAESVAKLLYVQSLLLGRYPLGESELLILNENLGALLQHTLQGD